MKKNCLTILSVIISVFSIFALVYYSGKFYLTKHLIFEDNVMVGWTIIVGLIIISLFFGIYNQIAITKQNNKLSEQVSHLSKIIDDYHYDELSHIDSTREIILDMDKGRN